MKKIVKVAWTHTSSAETTNWINVRVLVRLTTDECAPRLSLICGFFHHRYTYQIKITPWFYCMYRHCYSRSIAMMYVCISMYVYIMTVSISWCLPHQGHFSAISTFDFGLRALWMADFAGPWVPLLCHRSVPSTTLSNVIPLLGG